MSEKSRLAVLISNVAMCAAIALLTAFLMNSWGVFVRAAFFCAAGVGLVATLITYFLKKSALLKSTFILLIIAAVFLAAFIAVGEIGGLNKYETDSEKIKAFVEIIESTGAWGMVVFFLIQVLQIVILPLPAVICYVPGALIWGELVGTLLASAGVIVGSLINYVIGKFWGKKAVVWIAGKETTEKYSAYFSKKGKVIFVLMQILPFFPDDILCMVAGLTGMNFVFYILTIVLIRPLIIAAYCYLGSGSIIPFSGWGIWVWIAVFAVCIILAVLSFKYQDKVESWLVAKFSRKKKTGNSDIETENDVKSEPVETHDATISKTDEKVTEQQNKNGINTE